MRRAAKFLAGAGLAAGYVWAMVRRNESLEPPPMRNAQGDAYPEREVPYSDGARVSLVDVGEGVPLLLVPGADGVKETFRYQLPKFSTSHRVVAADLRSSFSPGQTFQRFADDLAELMDQLELPPAVVLGQSLGGAIAIRFASSHPERVRALVLSNTLARVTYEHAGLNRTGLTPLAMATTRYLPTALARWAARLWSRHAVWIFDDSPGSENVVEYALWTGPRTASPRVSSRRVERLRGLDLRTELHRIGAPTLVVKGPRDAYCPPEWSREIAAGIPDSAYVEVPGAGHCAHISRPGAFNRLVMDWVEARTAAASTDAEGEA